MTLAEISPYVAAATTVFIWTLTQRANRRHEIFKERLKRRVELFDGLLPEISNFISNIEKYNDDISNINSELALKSAWKILCDYRVKVLCYGTRQENLLYDELIDIISRNKMEDYAKKNNAFVDLVKRNLRSELGIEKPQSRLYSSIKLW